MTTKLDILRDHLQGEALLLDPWVPLLEKANHLFAYAVGVTFLDEGFEELDFDDIKAIADEVVGKDSDRWTLEVSMLRLDHQHDVRAEGNFLCCGTCCHAELEKEAEDYVFWHGQSDDAAFEENILADTLYIGHSGFVAAEKLVLEINANTPFLAAWSGDEDKCVEIHPSSVKQLEQLEAELK